MANVQRWIVIFVVMSGGVGCANYRPNFFHPGTTQQQRARAIVHDPYTEPDTGPEVVGGRPRDYQKPLAEPVRGRVLSDSWWGR